MKKLQVLGTGCPKCKKLFLTVQQAIDESGTDAEAIKVDDIAEIMEFGVMMTPALAVDGKVKVVGRVPRIDEIKELLED